MVSLLDKNDAKPFSVDQREVVPNPDPKKHPDLVSLAAFPTDGFGGGPTEKTRLSSARLDLPADPWRRPIFRNRLHLESGESGIPKNDRSQKFSRQKSLAAGLVAGAKVTVCSNGWFFGDEIALSRKHTSRLFEDLDERIEAGFSRIFEEWERNDLRVMNYREKQLDDKEAHDLVIRSVDAEALAPSAVPKVLREWREPWHSEFVPRNAWSLFNGFTEIHEGQAASVGRPNEDRFTGSSTRLWELPRRGSW